MNINIVLVILITLIFLGLYFYQSREKLVDKSTLTGSDYRLFQQTPAWKLAKAVSDQNTRKIDRILNNEPGLVNFQDPVYGNTLLMVTVQDQQYRSFKALLKNNADVNLYDSFSGSSAIIEACKFGQYDVKYVEKLLEYGAKVNDLEQGERKKGNSTRYTPLIAASRAGHLAIVKLLLKNGAEVNFQNEYGHTALSESLMVGEYEAALLLLENSADHQKPIFFREHENREMFIKDLLKEDTKKSRQKAKNQIISFLNANE